MLMRWWLSRGDVLMGETDFLITVAALATRGRIGNVSRDGASAGGTLLTKNAVQCEYLRTDD